MNCDETLALLHAYVDRELSDAEALEVHYHLDRCPPCRDHFHFDRTLKRLVHRCQHAVCAPPEVHLRVRARLREEYLRSAGDRP